MGTASFDLDDEDWACDEITDFETREDPLSWKAEADWNEVLSDTASALKQYLEIGLFANSLIFCSFLFKVHSNFVVQN